MSVSDDTRDCSKGIFYFTARDVDNAKNEKTLSLPRGKKPEETDEIDMSDNISFKDICRLVQNKLQLSKGKSKRKKSGEFRLMSFSGQVLDDSNFFELIRPGDCVIAGYGLVSTSSESQIRTDPVINVFCESALFATSAISQLTKTARGLEGCIAACGLPDLHPGPGIPIGAAVATESFVFPRIIGTDIGCGMSVCQTDIRSRPFVRGNGGNFAKSQRLADKIVGIEGIWRRDIEEGIELAENSREDFIRGWLSDPLDWDGEVPSAAPELFDGTVGKWDIDREASLSSLGTIGLGNHFAELAVVDEILEDELWKESEMDAEFVYLIVHSGSRGLGKSVGDVFPKMLEGKSQEALDYFLLHDLCIAWARRNRALISRRILCCLRSNGECKRDLVHNWCERTKLNDRDVFLHRKGAAPDGADWLILPGSRGSPSFIIAPTRDEQKRKDALFSSAHGAGRRLERARALENARTRHVDPQSARRTELNSAVVCDDTSLLFEESPDAYKDPSLVLEDLCKFGLAKPIARLIPIVTYKRRSPSFQNDAG